MKLHVKVTQEHIEKGKDWGRNVKFNCPIVLAIIDAGFIDASINRDWGICITKFIKKRWFRKDKICRKLYNFTTPLDAAKFIVKFDSPKYDKAADKFIYEGEPFEFDLELVES